MGRLLLKRRAGLSRDTQIVASARVGYAGLQLPGPVSAGTRWRGRLVPGARLAAGHGGIWRYPVADMVLASESGLAVAGLRVDFLVGGPLVVALGDRGAVLSGLQRQILEYERSLQTDAPVAAWEVRGRLVSVVPTGSEAALTSAIGLLLDRSAQRTTDRTEPTATDGTDDVGLGQLVEHLRSRRRQLLARHEMSA
jgi:hypothetical protein